MPPHLFLQPRKGGEKKKTPEKKKGKGPFRWSANCGTKEEKERLEFPGFGKKKKGGKGPGPAPMGMARRREKKKKFKEGGGGKEGKKLGKGGPPAPEAAFQKD